MSEDEREEQNCRDLEFLRPWIDAAQADVPEDAQWESARRDLVAQMESRGRKRGLFTNRERWEAAPSRAKWRRRHGRIVISAAVAATAIIALIVALRHPQPARPPTLPQERAAQVVARVETAWGRCVVLAQTQIVTEEGGELLRRARSGPTGLGHEPRRQIAQREGGTSGRGRSERGGKAAEKLLSSGDVLKPGDHVRVGLGSGLDLRLDDGSKLWLCPGTEVLCLGPRSSRSALVRLVRGEIRASITPSQEEDFSIDTPVAALHVLGTEFHVRVLPDTYLIEHVSQGNESSADHLRQLPVVVAQTPALSLAMVNDVPATRPRRMNKADDRQAATVMVTVLSGAVAIEAESGQHIVNEGERAVLGEDGSPSATEKVAQIEYLRTLLDERLHKPNDNALPETLFFVPVHEGLLHSLVAVDPQSGQPRHVTTFIGDGSILLKRFAPGLAYVKTNPLVLSEFTGREIGDNGQLHVTPQIRLVDLVTGAKLPLLPLRDVEAHYLQLSPDRRKVAMVGRKKVIEPAEYESGVLVLDLETLELKRLLAGAMQTSPHWSPDSRWLAISKSPPDQNHHEIVLIDTITGEVVETGLEGAGVYFTPDGKRLLYSSGFHEARDWSAGVPTWGNLFMADVPGGKPEQITHLPQGGAIQPTLSPDGTKLLYWEAVRSEERLPPYRLHMVDLETGKDSIVTEENSFAAFGDVRWLDENSRACLSFEALERDPETQILGRRPKVRLISLADEEPRVEDLTPATPECPEEYVALFKPLTDRLVGAFSTFQDALDAQDFHRIEEAQKQFVRARDLLAEIVEELEPDTEHPASEHLSFGGDPEVEILILMSLQVAERESEFVREDLKPYLEALEEHASLTPVERSVKVVRENLGGYMCYFLRLYHEEFGRLPPIYDRTVEPYEAVDGQSNRLPDFREWMQEMLKKKWKINHIRAADTKRARLLLVVPGDDPDKVLTSYEAVRASPQGDEFVLRTPVLANGKRLEVTYHAEKVSERTVHVQAQAREID